MTQKHEEKIAEAAALALRIKQDMHAQGVTNAQAVLILALGLDSAMQDACGRAPAEIVEVVKDTLRKLSEVSSISAISAATAKFLVDVAVGITIVAEQESSE